MMADDPVIQIAAAICVLSVLLAIGAGTVLWGRAACRHPQTREEQMSPEARRVDAILAEESERGHDHE